MPKSFFIVGKQFKINLKTVLIPYGQLTTSLNRLIIKLQWVILRQYTIFIVNFATYLIFNF
jgi:hypothetical protein